MICGSFGVVGQVDSSPSTPGSPEWAAAWLNDPFRIARALTPAEPRDPQLNPAHPAAESWPPGHELKIGVR